MTTKKERTIESMGVPEIPATEARPDEVTAANIDAGRLQSGESAIEISTQTLFEAKDTTAALTKLGLKIPQAPEIPPEREASYLIIAGSALGQKDCKETIIAEIKLLLGSKEFHITQDNSGNLVILAFAERGGLDTLLEIAATIRQVNPEARSYLGRGSIKHHRKSPAKAANFKIDDYPNIETQQSWQRAEPGTQIAKGLIGKIADPSSRIGSTVEITTKDEGDPSFTRLIEHKSQAKLKVGGPDRLIGYETEFSSLKAAVTDETTSLIILKGAAGMGKSRILKEALPSHPSVVLCSMAPDDRNVVGSGLATLARQLADAITSDKKLDLGKVDQALINKVRPEGKEQSFTTITLKAFVGMQHAKQIALAAKNPQAVADLCYNALRSINEQCAGNTLFVLEDLHHADRVSEPFITATAERYFQSTHGKTLLSMRPEESYRSRAQKNLLRDTPKAKLSEVSLEEGLDFQDQQISQDFVYYSLPRELREGRRLGEWPKKLGEIAKTSPFVMKTLVDSALTKDPQTGNYKNLVVDADTIEVTREFLGEIDKIDPGSDSDIANYFHERVASLPHHAHRVLQCLALIGSKASSKDIDTIMRMVFGATFSQDDLIATNTVLTEGGFIIRDNGTYTLQHESMHEIVIGSIKDPKEKRNLAVGLYGNLEESLPLLTRHHLLTAIATEDMDDQHTLKLLAATTQCLHAAEDKNDFALTYRISTATLATPYLQDTLRATTDGRPTTPESIKLLVVALYAQARSGLFLGNFSAVDEATNNLLKLHQKYPDKVDLNEVHALRFEKDYLDPPSRKIAEIFTQDLKNGTRLQPIRRLIMEIKLAFRQGEHQKVLELTRKNKKDIETWNQEHFREKDIPHPEFIEIIRMAKARAPFTRIRKSLLEHLDEDVLLTPQITTVDQQNALAQIEQELDKVQRVIDRYPLLLSPISELSIGQQKAEIAALRGDFDRAIEIMGDNWRINMQIGIHHQAIRAAKLKGDIQVSKALAGETPDREELKKAISTYSEEGGQAGVRIDDRNNFYKLALPIQIIRATGILLTTYRPEELEESSAELTALINTAFQELEYLDQSWSHNAEVPEVSYYLLGYLGHIIQAAMRLKIPQAAEIARTSSFITKPNCAAARKFSENLTDHSHGEIARKLAGLDILEQLQ